MNTITRRQALKSGVLGVASLTISERLLAMGGNNEALASLKPTLAKPGYGGVVVKDGAKLALPKGFEYVALRPCGLADVRRPADADLPRRQRLLLRRQGQGLDRAQPGGLPARARARPCQRLRPVRPGRRHRDPLQHEDRQGAGQRARPQRHRQQLQRRGDALGDLAHRRGEHRRQGAGLRRRARLRLRGRRARDGRRSSPSRSRTWGASSTRPARSTRRPESST